VWLNLSKQQKYLLKRSYVLVESVIKALEIKGHEDKALEVATRFSDLNILVDRDMALSTRDMRAVFSGVEDRFNQREAYRRKLYDRFIKPYEALLD